MCDIPTEIIPPNSLLKDLNDFFVDKEQNWFITTTNQRVHMKKPSSNDYQNIEALIQEYHQLLNFSNQLLQIPVGFYHPDNSDDYKIITLYAENQSLAEFMNHSLFLDSDSQKFIIISGVAYAMLTLHNKNVIHGRLCPSHILINKENEPILFNFGVSRQCKDINSQSDAFLYLAPEIINDGDFTEKSDVYSFGLLVNQLYSDTNIFSNLSLEDISRIKANEEFELSESIPEDIEEIISDCLSSDPNSRPTFRSIFDNLLRVSFQIQNNDIVVNYLTKIQNISKRKCTFRIPHQLLKLPRDGVEWNDKTENPIDFEKLEKVINPNDGKKAIIIMTIGEYETGKSTFLREITGNMAYRSGKGMVTQTLGLHIDGPYTKKDIVDNIFNRKFKTKINSLSIGDDTEIFFIDSQGLGDSMYNQYKSVLDRIYPVFSTVSTICLSIAHANDEVSVRNVFKIIRRIRLMEVNFITHAVLLIRDYEPFNSMKDYEFQKISNFCETFPQDYAKSHNENINYYISEYLSLLPMGDFKIYAQYLCSIWYDIWAILSLIKEDELLPKPNVLTFLHGLSNSMFNRDYYLMKKFVIEKKKFKMIKKKDKKDKNKTQKEQKDDQNSTPKNQDDDNQELVQDQQEAEKIHDIEKIKEKIEKIQESFEEEEEIFEDIKFSSKQVSQMKSIDDYYQLNDGNSAEIMHRCIRCSYYIASNVALVLQQSKNLFADIDKLYSTLKLSINNSIRYILPFLIGDFDISVNDFYQYSNQMQKDINYYIAQNDKKWLEHMKNEKNSVIADLAIDSVGVISPAALAIPVAGEIVIGLVYAAAGAMLLYKGIQKLVRNFIMDDKFSTSLFPFIWCDRLKKTTGKDFDQCWLSMSPDNGFSR